MPGFNAQAAPDQYSNSQASVQDIFTSAGGWFSVAGNAVYVQMQYGFYGAQRPTEEQLLGAGAFGTFPATCTGARFRNAVAGQVGTVTAWFAEGSQHPEGPVFGRREAPVEPLLAISALGDVNTTITSAAAYTATPADPASVTSTTLKMLGLAGAITPNGSRDLFLIEGLISSSGAGTVALSFRYGTGAAPANGAAVTGTAMTAPMSGISGITGGVDDPFSLFGLVTGLSPGTAYWFDLAVAGSSGGNTVTVRAVTLAAHDIL